MDANRPTMTTQATRKALEAILSATCVHHWDIEPPNGPTSNAVCRRCQATRTFNNVEREYTAYNGKIPPNNIGAARFDPRGGRR